MIILYFNFVLFCFDRRCQPITFCRRLSCRHQRRLQSRNCSTRKPRNLEQLLGRRNTWRRGESSRLYDFSSRSKSH